MNNTDAALTDAMHQLAETTRFDPSTISHAHIAVRRRRAAGVAAAAVGIATAAIVAVSAVTGQPQGAGDATVAGSTRGLLMMTQPTAGGAYPATLRTGTLVVTDNQCLALAVVSAPPGVRYAIYWPKGFTAERDSSGRAVLYDAKKEPVAVEGDQVSLGGGTMLEGVEYPAPEPDPAHPCAVGPIFLAYSVELAR